MKTLEKRVSGKLKADIVVILVVGLLFICILLVLAIRFPYPTPFQYLVFRVILSLSAAGVGAAIPGFISVFVKFTQPLQIGIRAAGAFAIFVIVYFANPAQLVVPEPKGRIGKFPGNSQFFSVDKNYDSSSGKIGDIGDITVEKDVDVVTFIYEAKGRAPHEWDWKYINGVLNPEPAQFTGVMYLDPPNNWGIIPSGGFDLRSIHRIIKWEALSLQEDIKVEFVIGGIEWMWGNNGTKQPVPYPGSMPRRSLGIYKLTEQWQEFQYDFSGLPDEYFQCVVGGFGWVISWGSNQISLNDSRTGAEQPKVFKFQIRNIRYEK